jgi:hypothetical protein
MASFGRQSRIRRVGGLAVSLAAAPFAWLWVATMRSADDPLTLRVRLDMAIWTAVLGTPFMIAARLLWRACWRQAGARLSALDGPAWLLAAAAATLPPDRRDWGAAMAAELAQVRDRAARWRFAAGCARAAVFPPGGSRAAVVAAPWFPAHHLGHAPAGDGGGPGGGAGRLPVAGAGAAARRDRGGPRQRAGAAAPGARARWSRPVAAAGCVMIPACPFPAGRARLSSA